HSFPARVGQTATAEIDGPFEGPITTRIDAIPFDGRGERLHPGGPLREPGRGWALWRRWKLHARLDLRLQEGLGALALWQLRDFANLLPVFATRFLDEVVGRLVHCQ